MQDEKQTAPDLGANPTPDPVSAEQGPSEEAASPTPDPTPAAPTPPTKGAKTADPLASEPATSSTQTTGEYAGFWIRFLAAIIDGVILGVVGGVIMAVFGSAAFVSAPNEPTAATTSIFAGLFGTMQLLIWAIDTAYFVGLTGTYGATLGKKVLGLRVVGTNGQKIGIGKAALREIIGKWVSAFVFGLGYLWVAFDAKKQGWHDKIAGTYVIKVR